MDELKKWIFIASVFFLFSCNEREANVFFVQKNIILDSENNAIVIENNNNFSVTFDLKINKTFPLTLEDIKNEIEKIEEAGTSYPISAFKYVAENTFFAHPFTSNNWQHNPELFLNSIGGGFCDDLSSVLAAIWKENGDSARIIGLNGHVVPEIKINENWQMYDPLLLLYFCSENGEVVSLNEIEQNSSTYFHKENICNSNFLFSNRNNLSSKFANFFETDFNNKDVTQWHLNYDNFNPTMFTLPSHSKLVIYQNNNMYCELHLSSKSKGEIQIPLVPFFSSGKMDLKNNNVVLKQEGLKNYFPDSVFLNNFELLSSANFSYISYSINPKLNFLKQDNFVEIISTNHINIHASYKQNAHQDFFGKAYLFFDTAQINYQDFYNLLPPFLDDKINLENFLVKKYYDFIHLNNSNGLDITIETQKIKDFNATFFSDEKGFNRKMIVENMYPSSVFYLFLSLKYNNPEYFTEFIDNNLISN